MKFGIIGSGALGSNVARALAKKGLFSNNCQQIWASVFGCANQRVGANNYCWYD